ncbi:hypothetical protein [Paenibacillus whitsoniae]|uniref:Uncharacterized protein n=1 Tax=Paenibacillus whitsoniae TaxID=2496558 RepID=A0A430JC15_9BACL|nr:hypothetical protein [Paenibacillus whitsoniae]RTE08592.1 hypothetical protein EJQ19_16545 [Paenibacillus whitsoniae]
MDKYESCNKHTGIDISREEYATGISFMRGRLEGHSVLIAAASERAWEILGPALKEIAEKNAHIPIMLSKLSYYDAEAALAFLRTWAERKKPVSQLWEEITIELENNSKLDLNLCYYYPYSLYHKE